MLTEEDYEDMWMIAHTVSACSCHITPPCDFCVGGYSLTLEDYVEWQMELHRDDPAEAYDRAMGILGR